MEFVFDEADLLTGLTGFTGMVTIAGLVIGGLNWLPACLMLGGLTVGLGIGAKVSLAKRKPFSLVKPVSVKLDSKPKLCPACYCLMKEVVTLNEFGKAKTVWACESPVHPQAIQVRE